MLVLSLALANTIAEPVRRLAEAAERVRRGIRSRQQIPDFTSRSDEIGHLSRALREMTQALYNRLDAIESFAADVAHELKNPLTSLRSALETLPRVKAGQSRDRLIAIMQHDVRRLDRLISDISDASRLDAELARGEAGPGRRRGAPARGGGDGAGFAAQQRRCGSSFRCLARRGRHAGADYFVLGHDSRLAQVVTNLIDNACSFSEPGGVVRVALASETIVRRDGEAPSDGSSSRSTTTGPAFRRTRSSAFSSASTRTGRTRVSARTRASGLSISRQIVEAHGGPHLGRQPARREPSPGRAGGEAAKSRCATARARASSSNCRRIRDMSAIGRDGTSRHRGRLSAKAAS